VARPRQSYRSKAEMWTLADEHPRSGGLRQTVDMALDYVLYQGEVFDALDRLAASGELDDVFSAPVSRSRRRVAEP
jgi:hypothetical protein